MGKASVLPARPAMWAIEAGAAGPGSEIARFGQRRFKVADVEHIGLEEIRERNDQGLLMSAVAFVCFATAFAYLVFDAGWRARFFIGSALLTFLGIMGLREVYMLQTLKLYELVVTLKGGERIVFTSSDRTDVEALALRLQASHARSA